jgi:gas vesicle protein
MSTDPDEIRSEIDQTQRELSADVNALTEKLSPPRMVERRVRHTRAAPDRVRRRTEGNPLAAGVIAFGAGWLLASLIPASEPEQQAASQVKDFAIEQGRPVAQQLGEAGQQAAQQLRESAQERVEYVKDTATDAATTVASEAHSAAADVKDQAQEATGRVSDQARPSGS